MLTINFSVQIICVVFILTPHYSGEPQCPLEVVDCPFHCAGCETQLPHKDMPQHTKEMSTHFTLLAIATQKLGKENQGLRHEVA